MCRITEEFEQRGIRMGEERGTERVVNICRNYQQTHSVEETAKACGTTPEEVTSLLKKMAILPE